MNIRCSKRGTATVEAGFALLLVFSVVLLGVDAARWQLTSNKVHKVASMSAAAAADIVKLCLHPRRMNYLTGKPAVQSSNYSEMNKYAHTIVKNALNSHGRPHDLAYLYRIQIHNEMGHPVLGFGVNRHGMPVPVPFSVMPSVTAPENQGYLANAFLAVPFSFLFPFSNPLVKALKGEETVFVTSKQVYRMVDVERPVEVCGA